MSTLTHSRTIVSADQSNEFRISADGDPSFDCFESIPSAGGIPAPVGHQLQFTDCVIIDVNWWIERFVNKAINRSPIDFRCSRCSCSLGILLYSVRKIFCRFKLNTLPPPPQPPLCPLPCLLLLVVSFSFLSLFHVGVAVWKRRWEGGREVKVNGRVDVAEGLRCRASATPWAGRQQRRRRFFGFSLSIKGSSSAFPSLSSFSSSHPPIHPPSSSSSSFTDEQNLLFIIINHYRFGVAYYCALLRVLITKSEGESQRILDGWVRWDRWTRGWLGEERSGGISLMLIDPWLSNHLLIVINIDGFTCFAWFSSVLPGILIDGVAKDSQQQQQAVPHRCWTLENPKESWRIVENRGESWRIVENRGESWRIVENL